MRSPPFARARTAFRIVGLTLLLAGASSGLLWLASTVDTRPLLRISLAGAPIPRSGDLASYLERRARRWADESVTIEAGYHVFRPTRAELGAVLPIEEALTQLRELGRFSNPLLALRDWWIGLIGPGHALRWRPRIASVAALDAYVERIRGDVDRLPVPGTFDPEGRPMSGLFGEALDTAATKRAIQRAISTDEKHVQVPTTVTPPITSYVRFDDADAATTPMTEQETEYRPGHGRAANIELAAQKLDGTVLKPGGTFSFNATIGKRERSRGFAPALELVNGELVQGIGGGVCQVAGTLHAAAFFAGLVVDEYRPHSRLSQLAYLRPGLDTMVAWPDHVQTLSATKDLRLRNPYPFPVVIRTSFQRTSTSRAVLRIALYGASKPFRVDWSFEEVDRIPASEVRRIDPDLPAGRSRVHQEGLDGLVILRRRTIYMPTGRTEEETRIAYPPTPRVLLVGSG